MPLKRLIPVVLMRNGIAVQSKGFRRYQALGNPVSIVERLSSWAADELVYLDISPDDRYDLGRDDLGASNRSTALGILEDLAERTLMPLTFGGRIRTLDDAARRIDLGADKVAVNSVMLHDPSVVTAIADRFGTQCAVVVLDAVCSEDGAWIARDPTSKQATGRGVIELAIDAERRGAGELIVQSVDRDGKGLGFDLSLIEAVSKAVRIPVVALGGAGTHEHLADGLAAGADAVAAANMFNYTEHAVHKAKRALHDAGHPVREPELIEAPALTGGSDAA
ncbi:MAG: HisA/HisF-related TIM barrel protein [Planctomycetota bacterium]